jgi:hypothetical protein
MELRLGSRLHSRPDQEPRKRNADTHSGCDQRNHLHGSYVLRPGRAQKCKEAQSGKNQGEENQTMFHFRSSMAKPESPFWFKNGANHTPIPPTV